MTMLLALILPAFAATCKLDITPDELDRVRGYAIRSPSGINEGDGVSVQIFYGDVETMFNYEASAPPNTVDFFGNTSIVTEHSWVVLTQNGRIKVMGRNYVFDGRILRDRVDFTCEEAKALLSHTIASVLTWARPAE